VSETTIAEVRALVATGLGDPDLQAVIDREEDFLVGELGAPISGERVQQVWRSRWGWLDSLYLARPTDQVTEIIDNGVTIDPGAVRVIANRLVERVTGSWAGPLIELRYTPTDRLRVVRVVIELCRLTLGETGFNSEHIGDYQYQRSGILQATATQIQAASRRSLVRSLQMPRRGIGVIRLGVDHVERVSA
jgi:hypothetical protein